MSELGEGLALYLAYTLTRDTKLPPNLLERAGMTVLKSKAKLDDLALAIRETIQHLVELLAQHGVTGRLRGSDRHGVLDEVPELGVLLLSDGGLERDRLLANLLDLAHAIGGELFISVYMHITWNSLPNFRKSDISICCIIIYMVIYI